MTDRVWLLRTPSHDRLVLAGEHSPGEYAATVPTGTAGIYSWTDITEAVREFVILNPEWVAGASAALSGSGG
jgi:hypothetical protein